jgi:hypothetical protein
MTEDIRAAICVPWRPGVKGRELLWEKVRGMYESFGLPVFAADSDPTRPFNRAEARNRAAEAAGEQDAYAFLDADTYIEKPQLMAAIQQAVDLQGAAVPYSRFIEMNPATGEGLDRRSKTTPYIVTGNVVVSRPAYEQFKWDERFNEYGFEDGVYLHTLAIFVPCLIIPGTMVTIDHPRNEDEVPETTSERVPPMLAVYNACPDRASLLKVIADAAATLRARQEREANGWT